MTCARTKQPNPYGLDAYQEGYNYARTGKIAEGLLDFIGLIPVQAELFMMGQNDRRYDKQVGYSPTKVSLPSGGFQMLGGPNA